MSIASMGGMTAGPSALGKLFVCVYNNQQHFSYRDNSGNIQDAWYGTDGWHLQKINNGGMTSGPSAVGDLFVCVYNNQQHFSYRDNSGNIQDAWYGTDGWHLQKINSPGLWSIGQGESDNEQGYALLQTGDVLTTNVYNPTSMRYEPSANAFVQDGNLPVMLGANSETGPGITLMDGRVVWFGSSGHTCIYTPGAEGKNGNWVQGPDLPTMPNGDRLVSADVPAILEPNGMVFLVASGPNTATLFLEFDPVTITFSMVAGAPSAGNDEYCRLLLLPNGHGLVSLSTGVWYDVTFRQGGNPSWAPAITSFPEAVVAGTTVSLSGTQLCGLSECQHFGDDNQQAEHYPTVRFLDSNGHTTYARAHDVTTRSIAPQQPGTVLVDVPASLTPGTYSVELVAMGIPSAWAKVKVLTAVGSAG